MARAMAGARSVVTSLGVSWTPMALTKNRVAANVSRLVERKAPMNWPGTVALSATPSSRSWIRVQVQAGRGFQDEATPNLSSTTPPRRLLGSGSHLK